MAFKVVIICASLFVLSSVKGKIQITIKIGLHDLKRIL